MRTRRSHFYIGIILCSVVILATMTAGGVALSQSLDTKESYGLTYYNVCAGDTAVLRAQPTSKANSLRNIPSGAQVVYISDAQNDFAYVRYDNTLGYIKQAHVEPNISQEITSNISYRTVSYCNEYITLRAKPSQAADSIIKIPLGSQVDYIGSAQNGFSQVRYLGMVGYAMTQYLADESDATYLRQESAIYSYEQMYKELKSLAASYPERIKLSKIGKSVKGKTIPVAIIGNTASDNRIMVHASIHGREYITSMLAMREIERMLKENDDGFLNSVCIHVIPMANPDGVEISQSSTMPIDIVRVYESDKSRGNGESNATEYLRRWRSNANGIDLNRNFNALWGVGALRAAPSSGYYQGSKPEDQPESRALANYLRKGSFRALLNYHASGSIIYYDFPNAPANGSAMSLAQAVSKETGFPLRSFDSNDSGGLKDYALLIGIPSITLEVGKGECPLDSGEFGAIWASCKRVMEVSAKWVISE